MLESLGSKQWWSLCVVDCRRESRGPWHNLWERRTFKLSLEEGTDIGKMEHPGKGLGPWFFHHSSGHNNGGSPIGLSEGEVSRDIKGR